MVKTKQSKDSKPRKAVGKKTQAVKRSTSNKTRSTSESVSHSKKRKPSHGSEEPHVPAEEPAAAVSSAAKSQAVTAQPETTSDQSLNDPMIVTIDRRRLPDRRSGMDRRQQNIPVPVERRQLERRAKVPRRRQIDPTTCERDYTPEEIEFMRALDEYKRASGRMFPTCSEILEVLKKLGYEKRPQPPAQPDVSQDSLKEDNPSSPAEDDPPVSPVGTSLDKNGASTVTTEPQTATSPESPEKLSTGIHGCADGISSPAPTENQPT